MFFVNSRQLTLVSELQQIWISSLDYFMKGKLIISTAVSLHFVKVERVSYQPNHIWANLKFIEEERCE